MGLRGRLRRLERAADQEILAIPQRDGTVERFPQQAVKGAYRNWFERFGAGEDAPPEHPMLAAVRNSPDPEWQNSALMCEDPEAHTEPIPDLSEPE